MINILETVDLYQDTWKMTFYFVVSLSLLIGLLWTYYQVFMKSSKKKENLKENIIYNHPEDVIENYNIEPKRKKNIVTEVKNNYIIKNHEELSLNNENTINYYDKLEKDEYLNDINQNKELDINNEIHKLSNEDTNSLETNKKMPKNNNYKKNQNNKNKYYHNNNNKNRYNKNK